MKKYFFSVKYPFKRMSELKMHQPVHTGEKRSDVAKVEFTSPKCLSLFKERFKWNIFFSFLNAFIHLLQMYLDAIK